MLYDITDRMTRQMLGDSTLSNLVYDQFDATSSLSGIGLYKIPHSNSSTGIRLESDDFLKSNGSLNKSLVIATQLTW